MRKRVVLSNTNALKVVGLQELAAENITQEESVGTVVSIPNQLIDRLRALDAFKPTQTWGMFKHPAILVRKETVHLGQTIERISAEDGGKETIREIVVGEKGSGKSLHLLQAISLASLKDWVVIHIPEGRSTLHPGLR